MLSEFWTDMHNEDWPALLAGQTIPGALRTSLVRGVLGRRIPPEISRQSIRSFPVRTLWHRLWGEYADPSINRQLLKRGFGSATGLYSLMFGDAQVIGEAKRQGLDIAFEQVISPEHPAIMLEERDRFPGIEEQYTRQEDDFYFSAHSSIWRDATAIIVPSNYVRDGVRRLGGDQTKAHLVPYALDESWFGLAPNPDPGRVLFVGAVGLRKGSHYLAQAARLLKERGVPCEIRAVGPVRDQDVSDPIYAGVTYVGRVPRADMRAELLRADVFVLPTLAEGSATAHIEALACGIPIVTTPNCGTLIQDGVEGYLVPIRDAVTLADRIEAIVTNRQLRDEMGTRARQLAFREHTWERYEERLVHVLQATIGTQPVQ